MDATSCGSTLFDRGPWSGRRSTRHDDPIYNATGQGNSGADDQCHVEATDGDGFPANKGSERNPQKKRAVIPGKYCGASAREVLSETGLLGGKEQLCYRCAQSHNEVDKDP